ncbi:hypothetical protein THAOC_09247, partial [Thalassiosira oceanica]
MFVGSAGAVDSETGRTFLSDSLSAPLASLRSSALSAPCSWLRCYLESSASTCRGRASERDMQATEAQEPEERVEDGRPPIRLEARTTLADTSVSDIGLRPCSATALDRSATLETCASQ